MMLAPKERASLYRTIWRWHFYAGLFVMPFVLILSVTGAIYLFKPQIDRWEERAFHISTTDAIVSPNDQLEAVLAANPTTQFVSYRLPARSSDAAVIRIADENGGRERDVFVTSQGRISGSLDPDSRISETVARIHSSLLAGRYGAWLVELAGCWAIVMFLSGLYLWWPSGRRLAGVLWPRLSQGNKTFWRDMHAVTGFWVSGFALVLLVTALPWAGVWGETFKLARTQLAWTKSAPDWKIGFGEGAHQEHDHAAMMKQQAAGIAMASLADIVRKASNEPTMIAPVIVKPPGEDMSWEMRSETQNRPLRVTIRYDMATGEELSRSSFSEKHVIDKAVSYGIAWHEGQLLGWVNQLIGVLTALCLIILMVSGFILWRRRKPKRSLGAPILSIVPARIGGVTGIIFVLALLLPMLALSLMLLWLFERLLLPRLPRLAQWLGVVNPQPA